MCGIAGFYNLKSDNRENIGKMLERISHRGPDGNGIWDDGCYQSVVLGHTRLAIIDLTETGTQPMESHSKRSVITYNGEIYNAKEILSDMYADGYSGAMRGTSDTEVLLEACEFYGVRAAVEKCRGMFAFALYDVSDKTLTLARDRIGEKPLYYGYAGDAFVFASELGAISAVDGFECRINERILPVYLKYGYIPAPHSIYENVWKLEPGKILKIKCELNKYKDLSFEEYWNITGVAHKGQQNLFTGSRTEAADELERLLKISVRGQMISDVDLGAFLSAGIDSSTIVSLMQDVSDKPVKTFTIGYEDDEYNEAPAASKIAQALGTEHTELYATKQDAIRAIPLMPGIFGEPFGDSSQIPTYLVSFLTRKHVTVALSGDGGDELFAGYRDYTGVSSIYKKIHGIPYPVRTAAGFCMEHVPGQNGRSFKMQAHGTLLRAKDKKDLYLRTYETWKDLEKLTLRPGETRMPSDVDGLDVIHTAMLLNMRMYHPDDILVKVDRTAMAVSLETRVPLLDKDIVSFAWTLPLEYLHDGNKGKLILRDVLYRHVPKELVDRPKKGFGIPVAKWIKTGELRDWANGLFNPDLIKRQEMLDPALTVKMWRDYIERDIWRPQIWYVLMLNAWLESMGK